MSGLAVLEPSADPLIGKTLAERYRVTRRLGEGGMGAVYEGEHLVIKKRVAIKVLHATLSTSPEVVARFHQEALAATSIGHEHIVEVNDMGRTPDGALFMVLELLQGRDFADLVEKESPLPIGRVVHIVMQMCDALQAAHDKGIVHRDLKPENVFLVKRGGDPDFAKVLDFGISKMQSSEGDTGPRAATRTGAIMGTALYMSPEQAMGKKSLDHRTDIWALGVILYRAITTQYPFIHEAFPALLLQICHERPAPPSSLRSDVDPRLDAIVMRCLEKDPAARPQSCAELLSALAPFRHLTAVMPSTRLSIPMPPGAPAIAPSSGVRARDAGNDAFARTQPADGSTSGATGPLAGSAATGPAVSTAASSELRPPIASRVPMLAGALVVVVVIAIGVGIAVSSSGGAVPTTDTATEPPVVAGAAPAPAEPAEPSPPAPSRPGPSIEFVVSPSEAVVLVDGRPIVAGEDGSVRRTVEPDDAVIHELRVEARGFRSRVEDLRLSYPQRIVISLDPGTGVDDRRASAGSGGGGGTGSRRHGGSSGTATSPIARSAATPAAEPVTTPPAPTTVTSPPPEPTPPASTGRGSAGPTEAEPDAPPRPLGLKRLPGAR